MKIPYRTRLSLKRGAIVAVAVLLVLFLMVTCWFVWLKRYIVYTRDEGAKLDMSLSAQIPDGEAAVPPATEEIGRAHV